MFDNMPNLVELTPTELASVAGGQGDTFVTFNNQDSNQGRQQAAVINNQDSNQGTQTVNFF